MDNLSQKEWDAYVKYALDSRNPSDQCFRVFGILLEDFDWDFERSDDHLYYEKCRKRQIDLRRIKDDLIRDDEKRARDMYRQASPWR